MRASAYVGRVGALAIALGIGIGAAGAGTAWAEPADSPASTSSTGSGAASDKSATAPRAATRTRVHRSSAPGTATHSNGAPLPYAARNGATATATAKADTVTASAPLSAATNLLDPPAIDIPAAVTVESVMAQRGIVEVSVAPAATAQSPVALATVATPAVSAADIDSVQSSVLGRNPLAPVESAVSWVVLAAARREIDRSPADQSMSGTVVATSDLLQNTGAASKPVDVARTVVRQAAALAASVESPQAITPVAAAAADNPIAAFVEQIQAFFTQIVQGVSEVVNQAVQAVTQAVRAIISAFVPFPAPGPSNSAPIAETPTVGVPDPATGVVTGQINATDPNGDILTYSAPTSTAKGAVVVDSTTGAFTYTPTDDARTTAGRPSATASDKTDTFTVTITDGRGGTATVTATVAIEAAQSRPDPIPGTPTVTRIPIDASTPGRTNYEVQNPFAFAVLKEDGSVVTWGDPYYGGDSSSVASQLAGGVTQIFSSGGAYAALKRDGSVVTWGDTGSGGDSGSVADELRSGVTRVFSTVDAFAALKSDGSVVTWGNSAHGGDKGASEGQLSSGVTQIFSNNLAFAAVKSDGSIFTWGTEIRLAESVYSGEPYRNEVVSYQVRSGDGRGVTTIVGGPYTFAALLKDGSVITWGDSWWGDSYVANDGTVWGGGKSTIAAKLTGVTQLCGAYSAFAALKSDGSVVSWEVSDPRTDDYLHIDHGFARPMGLGTVNLSSGVATELNSGVTRIYSNGIAFTALKNDGSVVAWGTGNSTGALPGQADVSGKLRDGVIAISATTGAFAALKTDGTVVAWGSAVDGGSTESNYYLRSGVREIIPGRSTFTALKTDGSAVVWGKFGSDPALWPTNTQVGSGVTRIFSNGNASTALKSDGSLTSWGVLRFGGDSSSVAGKLSSGVVSFADPFNDDRLA